MNIDKKPLINFRVYRRTQENIVLLFNKKNLNSDQLKNIKLSLIEAGIEKEIIFKTTNDIKDENIKDETIMMLINHVDNELDPYAKYRLLLSLGSQDVITQELVLFPFSVLPRKSKDNKNSYAFLFAWSEKDQCFCKLDGEYTKDGKFALLTKNVKE